VFTQNDWSPLAWTIMFAGMAFFVLALMGMLIFLVARAGEATSTPAVDAASDREKEGAEPRQLRVPSPSPAPDGAARNVPLPASRPAPHGHVRAS
jgi:Na+-transporting methylmalonyl-CoA/oxaloacetate decarboxylase gamma subunit